MRRQLLVAFLPVALLLAACNERTVIRTPYDGGIACGESEKLVEGECKFVCDRNGDCAANQVCNLFTGACEAAPPDAGQPVVTYPCTVGAERCAADNKRVEQCVDGGTWSTQEVCPGAGFCLNETCLACQPGLATCDAANPSTVTLCLNDGSNTRQIACAGAGICSQGECRECAPNTTRCSTDGKTVQTCSKTNDETLQWKWSNSGDSFDGSCITGVCQVAAGAARCKAPDCFPGTTQCKNSTTQQICGDNGAFADQLCSAIPGYTAAAECQAGSCIDECVEAANQKSYFGCEYWSAIQDNGMDPYFKSLNYSTTPVQGTADSIFAFVVANRSENAATVEVYRWFNNAEQKLKTVTVPGRSDPTTKGLLKIYVPWQSVGPTTTANVNVSRTGQFRFGYRLKSTRPVALYQFNPLDYAKYGPNCTGSEGSTDATCDDLPGFSFFDPNTWGTCTTTAGQKKCTYNTFSNDASLLLPAHILGTSHVALTVEHSAVGGVSGDQLNGHLTIVGTQDTTLVTVKSSAITSASVNGPAVAAMAKGESRVFTLNRYDVLQLADAYGGAELECTGVGANRLCRLDNDLTGTVITSDKPVAVFGGAACALKPYDKGFCDHIEEQIFPFATWGKKFVAHQSNPYRISNTAFATTANQAPDHYKIVASCPAATCPTGTLLTFSTPPTAGNTLAPNRCLTGTLATNDCRLAGATSMEFKSKGSFTVTADQPIAVAQFFTGQSATTGTATIQGDPSLILLPPAEQWRSSYTVLAAPGIRDNYLGLSVEPLKVQEVRVDGVAIPMSSFTAIANSTYSVRNHPVTSGPHLVEVIPKPGQAPPPGAGVIVYGFDSYVSYGYTGGLNLQSIVTGINPGG